MDAQAAFMSETNNIYGEVATDLKAGEHGATECLQANPKELECLARIVEYDAVIGKLTFPLGEEIKLLNSADRGGVRC